MTAQSAQRAAELAAIIARHSTLPPHQIAAHVTHLQRIARQAVTIATNLCNVPDYQPTFDRRIATLRKHAQAICDDLMGCLPDQRAPSPLDFHCSLGSDPRGPCLRLLIEGERGDGFGGADDGFAVY